MTKIMAGYDQHGYTDTYGRHSIGVARQNPN
ncbi:hypothetical protein KPHES18087_18010 [Corynebacterium ulcerans]|uniref:Uncharacterized protein n=1 Tax=Corynebacterium ulcerans TaxID=65058 RepID=A0ABD7MV60_CORUL|nr:Uncharacterised protein [Corynebacterium ulcerans]SQG52991.1 Uncharacterised protein [Corynebacterium ulcerans]SQG56371.1 Uncharacterised protein [Corynebacterium ulcerans]SQH03164.1 Uncharacterised protein [Corynebacterium ulcerans]STC81196.1 Uncharacterised protein [Corynebacterium ulcerans]